MTDYQDDAIKETNTPTVDYDITGGLETAATGTLTIVTGLTTCRSIMITPIYATASETVFCQVISNTDGTIVAQVTGDDGTKEAASIEAFWIATGTI